MIESSNISKNKISIRISTSWSSVSLENINHKYKVISTSERQGSLLEMIVKKL